jgi:hypothetical protein
MASKNKGGREVRKPKQEQNKKQKGQVPPPAVPALEPMTSGARHPKK